VASILQNTVTAGPHSVAFDASSLPSGLYFARLKASGFESTCKVILAK